MTKKITLVLSSVGVEIEQNMFHKTFYDIVNFYNAKLNQSTFIVEKRIG